MLNDQQIKQLSNRLEDAEQALKRERSLRQELEDERIRMEREMGALRVNRAGDSADISVLRDQISKLEDSLASERMKNT
jgi:septal ring factor EnvC (AmiA/AmiB activator)